MYRAYLLSLLSSLALCSPTQHPLLQTTDQQSLINKKPLLTSQALQDDINQDNLLKRAEHLYKLAKLAEHEYNHPTRVIGSDGHWATIDYIHSTIASLGDYYTLSNQTFPAVIGNVFEYRLILGNTLPASATAMSLTPPTEHKEPVLGPLVLVSNSGCDAADYPRVARGAIVLIRRGDCSFGVKSSAAGKAGAVAAVVYNNAPGRFGGTLGEPDKSHIATFAITLSDAAPIIEQLGHGKFIEGSAYINSVVEKVNTKNVIAQTRGGDQDNCVMLGGHTDSVAEGPGINDDGSGTLTLLEIATQLAKYKVNNCVRFAWWAGEEEGLLGSDYYVAQLSHEENKKIRLFMDYDMLASPNFAYQVYDATDALNPPGSQALRDLYTSWYEEQGQNWMYIPFDGRSDYDAFIKHGIPGGGIATGAEGVKTREQQKMFGGEAGQWYDPCYHQLCDGVENLNLTAWELNAKLVAHSVATYALSFEGFPERNLDYVVQASNEQPLYHGPKLIA